VGEAVEEGPGETLGAEDLGPFIERQVARDDDRALLVALAEDLEEQLCAGLGERDEAKLVDDEEPAGGDLLLQALEPPFVTGLEQLVDQRRCGREADGEALLAGRQAEAEGDVRLAGPAVSGCDDVLLAVDVFAASQLLDEHLVERGDGGEVEGVEALHGREPRRPDAPFDGLALAGLPGVWSRPPR